MTCPHCKSDRRRKAVITIGGDYWCKKCAPEVWELITAAKVYIGDVESYSGMLAQLDRVRNAIAALEVKEC